MFAQGFVAEVESLRHVFIASGLPAMRVCVGYRQVPACLNSARRAGQMFDRAVCHAATGQAANTWLRSFHGVEVIAMRPDALAKAQALLQSWLHHSGQDPGQA